MGAYFNFLSRKISFLVLGALVFNVVSPLHAQESNQSWYSRFKQGVADATPGFLKKSTQAIKSITQPVANKLKNQLSTTLSTIKSKIEEGGPHTIIPLLQDALKKLGNKVGSVSACMLNQSGCSVSERAAFISASVVVLALTAALIGTTLTVAATSKEVDTQVTRVSEELQGWGAAAIFNRLKNTVESFKESLESMKICLIKRECTKGQKRTLYATAATIAALATIAVGVGIGSFIYAKKQNEKERLAQEALEKGQAAQEAPESITNEPINPDLEMPLFGQEAAQEGKLSRFKKMFQEKIKIVNTNTLHNLYKEVQSKIKAGAIKAKSQAADFYTKALNKADSFSILLEQTLGVTLSKIQMTFTDLKESLQAITFAITNPIKYQFGSLPDQIKDLIAYLEELTNAAQIAEEICPLEEELNKEFEALELWTQNLIDRGLIAAKDDQAPADSKKPGFFKRQYKKLKKKFSKEQENEIKRYEEQRATVEQEQQALASKKKKQMGKAFIKKVHTPKVFNETVQEIINKVNNLELKQVGVLSNAVLEGIAKLINATRKMHSTAGSIGFIISDEKIQKGLKQLSDQIVDLGSNIRFFLQQQPLITIQNFKIGSLIKNAIKLVSSDLFRFLKESKSKFQSILPGLKLIGVQVDPIKQSLKDFSNKIQLIGQETKEEFIAQIKQEPLKNIAQSPYVLRNALSKSTQSSKRALNKVLDAVSALLIAVHSSVPSILDLLTNLDKRLTKILDKSFLNESATNALRKIVGNIRDMHHTIDNFKENIEEIEIATAPAA